MSEKGNSPFYPNHPVPPDFFVGRQSQLDRIMERGVRQVERGKMVPIFIQGEYGIGKTSLALGAQQAAQIGHNLHPIYCSLGGCRTLDDIVRAIFEATVRSRALDPSKTEKISNLFAKYIGKQNLFGVLTLNLDVLRADAPQLASPFGTLGFFESVRDRLEVAGIFLVLDEINGMAKDPAFAHFIKGLVDTNGGAAKPVPLLLMLCGIEECRREMIQQHQPVDRIFDVIEVGPMTPEEAAQFFRDAFQSVNIVCDQDAAHHMARFSAGFPKIMQLIGDAAFWSDDAGHITLGDAAHAVLSAAQEVGTKYFDQQVLRTLKSEDYRSILRKIASGNPNRMSFTKAELEEGLTESEKGKLNNFLQKMKKLNVIRSGDRGEYLFNVRMVRLYIWLQFDPKGQNLRPEKPRPASPLVS